jgi:hypothetical protein
MGLFEVNPIDFPALWDTIKIAGKQSPGIATITDSAGRPYKWDKKEGPGTEGDTKTYRGQRSSDFSITFLLWTREHFAEWDAFSPLLEYDASKGKAIKAVAIEHPGLNALKIRNVIVEFVGVPQPKSDGTTTIKVDFSEYYPAKNRNATGTPTSAKSSSSSGPGAPKAPSQAKSKQEEEIERLLAEAKKP